MNYLPSKINICSYNSTASSNIPFSEQPILIPEVNESSNLLAHTSSNDYTDDNNVVVKKLKDLDIKLKETLNLAFDLYVNPSDFVTRPSSFKVLQNTNFYSGPEFLKASIANMSQDTVVNIPNPVLRPASDQWDSREETVQANVATAERRTPQHVLPIDKYADFFRMVRVCRYVLLFIDKLKLKRQTRCQGENNENVCSSEGNLYKQAYDMIVRTEQEIFYPEVFNYFHSKPKSVKNIPDIVLKLNLYTDDSGVLRVKSKIPSEYGARPALLPKESLLTRLIIRSIDEKLSHNGIYPVLKDVQKIFYSSTVKKVLKECIVCRRLNERPIKLNQSSYRDFRVNLVKPPMPTYLLTMRGPLLLTCKVCAPKFGYY